MERVVGVQAVEDIPQGRSPRLSWVDLVRRAAEGERLKVVCRSTEAAASATGAAYAARKRLGLVGAVRIVRVGDTIWLGPGSN